MCVLLSMLPLTQCSYFHPSYVKRLANYKYRHQDHFNLSINRGNIAASALWLSKHWMVLMFCTVTYVKMHTRQLNNCFVDYLSHYETNEGSLGPFCGL